MKEIVRRLVHGAETIGRTLSGDKDGDPYASEPRPLVFSELPAAISWSAKSASTQVLVWYLVRENLLDAALAHDKWVHHFRTDKLYRSNRFRRAVEKLKANEAELGTLVRVMRNPLNRLVSSYRHALLFGYADKSMSKALGRKICSDEGYSIAYFLEHLKHLDTRTCNIHFRCQLNPIDSLAFDRVAVVNVDRDSLFPTLNDIEEELGLTATRFDEISYFKWLDSSHHAKPPQRTVQPDIYNHAFSKSVVRRGFPARELRALPQVQQLAMDVYHLDYTYLEKHDSL